MKKIAITGLGLVCPLGNKVSQAVENAFNGKSGIRCCKEKMWGTFGANIPTQVGGLVTGFNPAKYVPEKYVSMYDPTIVFALAAVEEALIDSGIEFNDKLRDQTAVLVGTATTGTQSWHRTTHKVFFEKKAEELPGSLVMQMSGNMPSGIVALNYRFRGPNIALVNACSTGINSVALGASLLQSGKATIAIVGATDCPISPAVYGPFCNAGAAHCTKEPHRACRPFSKDRKGFVLGEGAGIIVLETMEHAKSRGGRIYGEVLGDAQTNDAFHIIRPDPSGQAWARTIKLAIESAGVQPEQIDYVSAHAPGTMMGDAAEVKALTLVLGKRSEQIPVSSTKSMHGHLMGATGAVELVLSLGAMSREIILPTINLDNPDPELDLDFVPHKGRAYKTGILLKNSFGFGGTSASLVIRNNCI